MIRAREHVPVAIHGDLEGGMAGEGLHRLRREPGLDPAGHGEVPQAMPVEPSEGPEATLDQPIVARVPTPAIGEHEIGRRREPGASRQAFRAVTIEPDRGTVRTPAEDFGGPSSP